MSGPDPQRRPPCPPESVLEEWAVRRLDDAATAGVDAHLEVCPGCAAAARRLRNDADCLTDALVRIQPDTTETCPATSVLAQFIDGSLGAQDRESTERHIAGCGRCRARAAALFSEVLVLRGDRADTLVPPTREPTEIVELPERSAPSESGETAPHAGETARKHEEPKPPRESQR